MAKKLGEHGENLNRTAHLWHLSHLPAVAAEFGDTELWGTEKISPDGINVCARRRE
jgi:hypothetical protein